MKMVMLVLSGSRPDEPRRGGRHQGETGQDCHLCGEQSAQVTTSSKKRLHIVFSTYYFSHNIYVYKFILCEFLNLVNIVGQMYLMDVFFNGHFTSYGSDILTISNMDAEKRVDPMAKVFPKMAKCK